MGQEITDSRFERADFERFSQRLHDETDLLRDWVDSQREVSLRPQVGFELEAWLVDSHAYPAPVNQRYLQRLAHPLAVPELAQFNIELNSHPQMLAGRVFSVLFDELQQTWQHCQTVAQQMMLDVAMIGILPTVRRTDLTLGHMSAMQRYQALNEQIFRMRQDRPIELNIDGDQPLHFFHPDVMLESATTSFQLHLKMGAADAVRLYNAAKLLAGPMVAVSANSPLLFGHRLWHETRIPLFEKSVEVGRSDLTKRVSFGIRYAEQSIMEVFDANLRRYPVLLPRVMDEPPAQLAHLRLHNGTIWRWNRPLIGFDADGSRHLRLEHRVVPSGPTPRDAIANAALFFGAVVELAAQEVPPESLIPFEVARENFYQCARHSLQAEVRWLAGHAEPVRLLLGEMLLPLAADGLRRAGVADSDIADWLGVIDARLQSGQNGAIWQRRWIERHGQDMVALTHAYLRRQASGEPVHAWDTEG